MNRPAADSHDEDREWIAAGRAASRLGLTDRHVRRLCENGTLTATRSPKGRWSVDARSLEAFAAGLQRAPVPSGHEPDMSGHESGHDGSGGLAVRAPTDTDHDGAAMFSDLERFALKAENAQLRLQLQAMTAERDQARRDEARALLLVAAHRHAFEAVSDATLATVDRPAGTPTDIST